MDFLDKMKKGMDTIGAKGKELMEDAQAQLQLSSLRDKRQKALEQLGVLAFALFQKGGLADPEIKLAAEAVADLDRQIEAKQAELKDEKVVPAPSTALVHCDCGAELASGIKFCSACGKKIG